MQLSHTASEMCKICRELKFKYDWLINSCFYIPITYCIMINEFMTILQGYQSKFCFPLELKEGVLNFALNRLYSDFDLALLAYGKWVYTSYSHMFHTDKFQIISTSSIITKTQISCSHLRVYVLNLFTIILPDIKIEHVLVWVNINESFSENQENNFWPLESDVWWVSFFRLSKIYAGKAVVWRSLVQIEQGRNLSISQGQEPSNNAHRKSMQ